MSDQELVRILKEGGVYEWHEEPVRLSSGIMSHEKFNVERLFDNPAKLRPIANALSRKIDKSTTGVACCGNGGIPIGTLIADEYGLKLTIIEKEEYVKTGKNPIGGYVPTRDDVLFPVDDVYTRGGTMRHMIRTVGSRGAALSGCGVVINRYKKNIDKILGVPFHYLVHASELVPSK